MPIFFISSFLNIFREVFLRLVIIVQLVGKAVSTSEKLLPYSAYTFIGVIITSTVKLPRDRWPVLHPVYTLYTPTQSHLHSFTESSINSHLPLPRINCFKQQTTEAMTKVIR